MEIFENSQSHFENLSPVLLEEDLSSSLTDDDFSISASNISSKALY